MSVEMRITPVAVLGGLSIAGFLLQLPLTRISIITMPVIRNQKLSKSMDKKRLYTAPKKRAARRSIPRTERLAKKAAHDNRTAAIKEKIRRLWDIILEFAEEEAPKLNATVDEIVHGLLSLGRRKTQTRRPNTWNAFQHSQAVQRKAGARVIGFHYTPTDKGPVESAVKKDRKRQGENHPDPPSAKDVQRPSEGPENNTPPDDDCGSQFLDENHMDPDVVDAAAGEDPENWLTDEESSQLTLQEAVQESKKAYTETSIRAPEEVEALKQKLEEHRATKEATVKKQFIAHQADVRKTLDRIDKEVSSCFYSED